MIVAVEESLMDGDVRWSCSAYIDLLGFSNQVALAGCDLRTQMGEQAVQRLAPLEQALQKLEDERNRYPQLYPAGLKYVRFNDALFLGIDVEFLSPPSGSISLTGGYSASELLRAHSPAGEEVLQGTVKESAEEVAKFLGLVARVHNYINAREAERSFPGSRTVVASGLRKRFQDRGQRDDFFAANLSVSIGFAAQEKGSKSGIKGNSLYVEDDVAVAVSYNNVCHAILAMAKFLHSDSSHIVNPYHFPPSSQCSVNIRGSWTLQEPIVVQIMNHDYVFRRLNPSALTNLQLSADYRRIAQEERGGRDFGRLLRDALNGVTPTLDELNTGIYKGKLYPFLLLHFGLDEDYGRFLAVE